MCIYIKRDRDREMLKYIYIYRDIYKARYREIQKNLEI